jgi:DNA-binding transcriptional regulator YhcF (GntR family)
VLLLHFTDDRPIFIQVAEQIENGILADAFPEGSQVPSTTEISVQYKINPATVLKGMNLLVDSDILFKKRGVGMFVSSGARSKIRKKRKGQFYDNYIIPAVSEAKKLGLPLEEILSLIERGFDK